MERALKERIVGAIVLVAVVVLIVPVFLDGPDEDAEVTSERVLLPGQDEQDMKTVVLDRERTVPIPVASDTTPDPVAAASTDDVDSRPIVNTEQPAEPDTEVDATVAAPPPAATSEPDPSAAATGMWAVQLGSFANRDNAEQLAAGLRKQDYAAFLSRLETAQGVRHRVRIGPMPGRAAAEAMAARLVKVGHNGQVVPHP